MPVQMRGGREYKTVNERLEAAHGEAARPVGITSIVTTLQSLPSTGGPVVFAVATITFADGRVFTGISEAQFDATSGADKTNPIEVAETSSVGRGLAMAGFYGSEEGLAGAEEIQQAQRRERQQHAAGGTRPLPPAEPAERAALIARYQAAWDAAHAAGLSLKWPREVAEAQTPQTIAAAAARLELLIAKPAVKAN